jgi:anaerobic selenocysteine-containing dehydrogenase
MTDQPKDTPSSTPPPMGDDAATATRRDVLGAFGLAGAGMLAGGVIGHVVAGGLPERSGPATSVALKKPYVPGAEHFGSREEKWVATSCAQCTAGCGIRVRVVEGRAVRIDGNPANPINRGGIGPRGLAGLQALYDADRIPGPLVREGGNLVPIPWDRAIAMLVDKLGAARKEAPESLLVMSGRERGVVHDLWARFCQAFGTPNFVDGRPSRSSILAQATMATLGVFEVPTFDWSHAKSVLSLGAGLLEDSCQLVYLARSAADTRRGKFGERTRIVHAGPMFDLSANAADQWLRIHTGSSAPLALGIAHVLLRDKLADHSVETAPGFAAFAQMVSNGFSPAAVSEMTGLEPETIEELAHDLAERRPSFVYADERTFAFSNGWETALAVLSLNALLGAIGTLVHIQPQPPYAEWPATEVDEAARNAATKPRLDGAGTSAFELARAVHETLPDAITANPPHVLLLDYANPAYARKQPERWKQALAKVPFIVSFSPFRDESVETLAHLVLPDHTYLERWDDAAAAPSVGGAVAGIRRPVVAALFDTRSTGDVLVQVARALGGSIAKSFPWEDTRVALEARLRGLFEARRGSIIEAHERAFYDRMYAEGFWVDTDVPAVSLRPFVFRAEFTEAKWDGAEAEFPLKLIAYRPVGYAEGSGANLPWLRQLRVRPNSFRTTETVASIHPATVEGLENGDRLRVESPFGAIEVLARLDARMAKDTIAIPMGGGHEAFGRWAKGRGANVMRLLAPGPAAHTGANSLSTTRVRVKREVQS